MRRDYYAVLGVAATAGPREVRRAYQRLARQYSPDVNFWDERARELFEEIAEAFRVLGDPAARAMYDRFGSLAGADSALGAGRRGDDVHGVVELSFADVAGGLRIRMEVNRFSPCAECAASGASAAGRCPRCLGRGVRRAVEPIDVTVPAGADAGALRPVHHDGGVPPDVRANAPLRVLVTDRGQRYTLLAALLYAPSVITIKQAILASNTAVGTFGPYFAASLIVTPLALTTSARHFRAVPRHWKEFVALGLFAALTTLSQGKAYTLTLSSYVEAVKQVEILYAMAIGALAFGEGRRVRESALGALVMLLGMVLLALAT